MKRSRTSAGLLIFRRREHGLEVLLVHPGGPFFRKKDLGAWTIPKGEATESEDLKTRAATELEEELGFSAPAMENWIDLGSVKQKGGKTVHGWAVEMELPKNFRLASNNFEIEWPPRSGRTQQFAEIDRAEFFPLELAAQKINPAQTAFLDRLVETLDKRNQP